MSACSCSRDAIVQVCFERADNDYKFLLTKDNDCHEIKIRPCAYVLRLTHGLSVIDRKLLTDGQGLYVYHYFESLSYFQATAIAERYLDALLKRRFPHDWIKPDHSSM